jgi:predicted secreted protein
MTTTPTRIAHHPRSRLVALAAALGLALTSLLMTAPAQAKPVDNTVTLTILPAQLRLTPGESATIRLSTNYTTGYSWTSKVTGKKKSVRVLQMDPAPIADSALIGAATTTDWVVTAKRKGTATVTILTSPPGSDKTSIVGALRIIVM